MREQTARTDNMIEAARDTRLKSELDKNAGEQAGWGAEAFFTTPGESTKKKHAHSNNKMKMCHAVEPKAIAATAKVSLRKKRENSFFLRCYSIA